MKRSSIIAIVVAAAVLVTFAVVGARGNDMNMNMSMAKKTSNTMSNAKADPNTVIMDNLDFQQKVITVKVGQAVTWKNMDTARHNVIFDDANVGKVEGDKLIASGEELHFTFTKAGTFSYFCEPHPFMKAKIIVTN